MKTTILFALIGFFGSFGAFAQSTDTLFKSSVQEIMKLPVKDGMENILNAEVVTVSNTAEKIGEAPATTIIITRKQIADRGYTTLLDILHDLPDMDVALAYGDNIQYKSYWRGNRSDLGAFFMLMIDGVILNNLYFNEATSLVALPMTAIEKIEVVYGPASATYGANAFMGVINVITYNKDDKEGISLHTLMGSNYKGLTWADLSLTFQHKRFKVKLSARTENGDVNQLVNANSYEWLKDEHYANTKLWGDMSNNPTLIGNKFSSRINHKAVDLRVMYDKLEVGLQHFRTISGSGLEYVSDRLREGRWEQPESNVFVRYQLSLSSTISSQTLLRYRESYVDNSSFDIEGYNISNSSDKPMLVGNGSIPARTTQRVVQLTHWGFFNASTSFFQNFEWRINEKFTLNAGLKYENKDLQKAYETYASDYFLPDLLTNSSDILPPMPPRFHVPYNRILWQDRGVFAQLKWRANANTIIQLGYRFDHNSAYGAAPTLRGSIVKRYKQFIFKAFYGEAFQEPSPRVLYGGWTGSGSDPNLLPERSKTAEIAINFTSKIFSHDFSGYVFTTENAIIGLAGGAKNLGKRQVLGLSYRLQGELPIFKQTNYWFYYSLIMSQTEQKFDAKGDENGTGIIGDLSPHKLQAGFTSQINNRLTVSLSSRFYSNRATIDRNPVRNIAGYFLLDANINYRVFKNFLIGLKVVNIFNKEYFHAGVRAANGGDNQGSWDGKAWNGSKGFFSSKLPQATRNVAFNLSLNF